jgi:acyl-CoA synthetase (AMP-forming)/AMP-acid ligase II
VIAHISAEAEDLLARLHDLRAAGHVPLVGDPRWSSTYRDIITQRSASTPPIPGAAWAALTSGSSGSPRIVIRTERSWAASFEYIGELLHATPRDQVILPAPASSSLTLFSLAHALSGGPRPLLGNADRTRAVCMHGTPQGLQTLLEHGAPPGLRTALVGGSHLDPSLRARAAAAGIRVVGYYGAAELSFVAIDDGDGLRPFPGVDWDVRDGVLWVRSPFVALGYVGDAGPLRRDGEWATVGDRAEVLDGRLRLLGRADDAILSASATIVPAEVEAVLRSVRGVRDAVVFGIPRPRIGTLVAAFIETDRADPTRLRTACRDRLAPAHRPRRWFAGVLPRTASGKPARAEAVRQALAGEVSRLAV